MAQDNTERLQRLFGIVAGEDSLDRGCEAIPDQACAAVPRNYFLNLGNGAATKLAEQIAGPNLVLPWLFTQLGAPVFLVGLLMPVKQVGSLLPQMIVAGQIRRFARRKWFWVTAGLIQAFCLLLMIPAAVWLAPFAAGLAIVALLAVFSVASGMGSVAFQDVLGKTIPKGVRGRLLSHRAVVGGVLTTLAGLALKLWLGRGSDMMIYLGLVGIAAGLWAAAALVFAVIEEVPGATAGGRNAIEEAGAGVKLLREQRGYRRYLIARVFLLSIELAVPFYVLHAQSVLGRDLGLLGIFVIAVGLASVVSSHFWGRFVDADSRQVMVYSGLLGALAALLALLIGHLPAAVRTAYLYSSVFVMIGLAEAGVRLGRKTYLVDGAPEPERATYVAFANTGIGVVTLAAAGMGLIAQHFGTGAMMGVLCALGLLGAAMSRRLPRSSAMVH